MNRTQDGPRRWLAAAISRRVLGVTTALLLLGVFITLPSPAAAQTATVTASGSTSGGQATLTVSISGVTNLISAGFRVGFNPAEVLTTPLPSGVSGGFLNVSPFVNPNSAGDGVGFVLLNGAAASGSGVLGVLTFTLASGVTSTTFTTQRNRPQELVRRHHHIQHCVTGDRDTDRWSAGPHRPQHLHDQRPACDPALGDDRRDPLHHHRQRPERRRRDAEYEQLPGERAAQRNWINAIRDRERGAPPPAPRTSRSRPRTTTVWAKMPRRLPSPCPRPRCRPAFL